MKDTGKVIENVMYVGVPANNKLKKISLGTIDNDKLERWFETFNQKNSFLQLPTEDNERQDNYKNVKRRNMKAAIIGKMKEPVRKDENIIYRTILPIDLDSISETITSRQKLSERLSALLGVKMYIFPSLGCNYRDKGLRFHVWLPLNRPVNKEEYQALITYYNQLFKSKGIITKIDRSNKTWSQLNGLPHATQYMDKEVITPLILINQGKLLDVDRALTLARQNAVKNIKPVKQVSKTAAEAYIKDKQAIDVVTSFAKRNKDWLSTYNNFVAAYFAIKGAEQSGEINHSEALECVKALAGDDTAMAEENAEKYENDHSTYRHDKGLSWFVQSSQVNSDVPWITVNDKGATYVRTEVLADELMKQYPIRFNTEAIGNGGSIWLYGHWRQISVDSKIRSIVDQLTQKHGVWTRTIAQDVLRYIKDNNPAALRWEENKFDKSNPRLIEFNNGTLNLDTMELETNKPENLIPIHFNYNWNTELKQPEQFCQHWQQMLIDLTGNDGDAVNTLYRFIGYSYERDYRHQVFVVLDGRGNNGKSYFINLIKDLIIGEENVSAVGLDRLASDDDRFSSSKLYHKTLNLFSDISSNFLDSTGALKQLTGDDTTNAEFKGKDSFSFTNYAKLLFSANELPTFKDDSHGFKRRPRVITFNQDFNDDETLNHFQTNYPMDVLKQEAQAFRQFCIEEYHRNMNDKAGCFPESVQMKKKKKEWFSISSSSSEFFEEMTDYNELAKENNIGENAIYLYQAYLDWTAMSGVKPLSKPKFELKVQNQYEHTEKRRVRLNGRQIRCWVGVRLNVYAIALLEDQEYHQDKTRHFKGGVRNLVRFDDFQKTNR